MAACPNPNSPEWAQFVKDVGEFEAYRQFAANDYKMFDATYDLEYEFEKYSSSKSTSEIVAELEKTQREVKEPAYSAGKTRYTILGREIETRVTDLQKKIFGRNKTKAEQEAIDNDPKNIIRRDTGIKLHAIISSLIKEVNGGPKIEKPAMLSDLQWKTVKDFVRDLIIKIDTIQSKIDPTKRATILTEQRIFDSTRDIAGSLDILTVFSDGSGAVYDFKFINFYEENGIVSLTDAETKFKQKYESWTSQMSEYKRILSEVYGIKLIRNSRMIPANIQFQHLKKGSTYEMTNTISKLEIGLPKEYLQPVPVAQELTDDIKLNEMLSKLFSRRAKLKARVKESSNKRLVLASIDRLDKAIKEIQLNKNVVFILDEIINTLKYINKNIDNNDSADPLYIDNSELKLLTEGLKTYSEVSLSVSHIVSQLEKDEKKELSGKMKDAFFNIQKTLDVLESKLKERILETATKEGVANIFEIQKEITGGLGVQFKYFDSWGQPIFKLLQKKVHYMQDKERRDSKIFLEELDKVTKGLEEFGKKNGKSGNDIFDYIYNSETGKLVTEYSTSFWNAYNKAIEDSNAAWFKENYHQTAEDKVEYEKKLKEYEQYLEKQFHLSEKEKSDRKKYWLKKNDLANDSAWLNKYSKKTLKNPEKHESAEYKFIKANSQLKDYYTFYKNATKKFNKFFPDVELSSNFVPTVHKNIIDSIAQNGLWSIKGMGEALYQTLTVRQADETFGMIDVETGKEIASIPILFTRPLMNSKGEVDNSLKSKDLSKSLGLFAEMAYHYKYASQIEDDVLSMREILASQDQILTDKWGNAVIDNVTKKPIISKEGKYFQETVNAFDGFVNKLLYGKSLEGKDIMLGNLSGTKILKTTLQYNAIRLLALQPITALAAFGGGTANLYMIGSKGIHFTTGMLNEAEGLMVSLDKKAIAAFKYFESTQENLNRKRIHDLSVNKLSKVFSTEWMMGLLRKADTSIDFALTVAMMKGYVIDSDGKVRRKTLAKDQSAPSLWDLAEVKNDKFDVKGLTDEQYDDFRRKVLAVSASAKGEYRKENIALYNSSIVGQTLMQFRNWMPALFQERFRNPRFNETLEEVELGRYKVFFGELVHKTVIPKIGNMVSMLSEIGTFGLYKYKGSNEIMLRKFEEFVTNNPEVLQKYSREEAYKMFQESWNGQLRAAAAELRMYILVVAFAAVILGGDWDDDGEKNYKEIPGGAQFLKLANKLSMELGFFFIPSELTQLAKSPFALMGLLTDTQKLLTNSLDEIRDTVTQEDYKGVFDWEIDKYDRTPKGKYTVKFIPIAKSAVDVLDLALPSKKDPQKTNLEVYMGL